MSSTSHTAHSERPERSRNAKAQARHRAKRKAYIDQLEQTVTKLQLSAGYSQEQINAMPPPLLKIRELEQENGRLQKENDELRRLLTDSTSHARFSSDAILRRTSVSTYPEFRGADRDYKRRKGDHSGSLYMTDSPPHSSDPSSRPPPPLTIPQPLTHHYGNLGSNSSGHNQSAPLFNLPNPGFQMPNTPSGSSATSSPPFSPAQMQPPLHSSLDHRSHVSDHSMSNNYTSTSHYTPVKVEDEHYVSNTSHQHSIPYSYANGQSHSSAGLDWQGGYSSERVHLQR